MSFQPNGYVERAIISNALLLVRKATTPAPIGPKTQISTRRLLLPTSGETIGAWCSAPVVPTQYGLQISSLLLYTHQQHLWQSNEPYLPALKTERKKRQSSTILRNLVKYNQSYLLIRSPVIMNPHTSYFIFTSILLLFIFKKKY